MNDHVNRPSRAWRLVAILTFPLLVALFANLYLRDSFRYIYLLREDGPVEWLTFAFLALAGLISLDIGIELYRRQRTFQWFFFAFGLFCLVMGLEEISWGQRVFAITPPDYFLGNSDQQEINVHNVLQQKLDFKTKDLAALVLSIYGVALPLLALNQQFASLLQKFRLVVPPLYLSVGFLIATLLMFDVPSGFEEEIGEFLFGLSFLYFMFHELTVRGTADRSAKTVVDGQPNRLARLERPIVLGLVVLAFGMQVWQLDAKGLWLPEAVTAVSSQAPLGDQLVHHWFFGSFEMPSWLWIAGAWQAVSGTDTFALRFISAMAAIAAIPLLWTTLRSLWPSQRSLRLLATFLLAIAPSLRFYGQDLSPYALLVTLTILSIYLLVSAMTRKNRWSLVAWMLVSWFMTSLHLAAILVVMVEAIVLVVDSLREEQSRRRLLGLIVAVAALLPGVLWLFSPGMESLLSSATHIADPEDWSYSERLQQLWKDLTFGSPLWQSYRARLSVVLVPIVLCGTFVLLALRHSDRFSDLRIRSSAFAWLLLGPLLLVFGVAFYLLPAADSAVLMVALPSFIVIAALGIVYLWHSVRLVGIAALILVVGLALTGLVAYADDGYAKSDYRTMTQLLAADMAAEDGILLMAPSQQFLADYYLAGRDIQSVPLAEQSLFLPKSVSQLVPHEVDGQIQQALAEQPVLWLALFDDESVDPGRFLQPYLTAVSFRDNCTEWRDVELCRYVSANFIEPVVQQAVDALYAETLQLRNVTLATTKTSIWQLPAILAELDWVAVAQPDRDYKVSLRLMGDAGQVVAQRDDFPIGPLLPPTTWAAGDEKPGFFLLPLPADLPVGSYSLQTVLYDPNDLSIMSHRTMDEIATDAPLFLATATVDEEGNLTLD